MGYEAAAGRSRFEERFPLDLLRRLCRLGIELAITVYPAAEEQARREDS